MRNCEVKKIHGLECKVSEGRVYGVYYYGADGRSIGGYYVADGLDTQKNILPCSVEEFKKATFESWMPELTDLEKDFFPKVKKALEKLDLWCGERAEAIKEDNFLFYDEQKEALEKLELYRKDDLKKIFDTCVKKGCRELTLKKYFKIWFYKM